MKTDVLASTVTTGTFKIKASATANGRAGTFTLIKLDSIGERRKNLAGAEFTLYKFDMDNINATPATVTTLKTDEDGRVTFGEGTMDELELTHCSVMWKQKLRQAISWIILLIISCLKETVLHRATSWQSIV